MLLVGQVVESSARRRWFRTQRPAPWASQLEVVAIVVAATTDRMASAPLGGFAVAVAAVNTGDDVGGRRRRMVGVHVVVGEERVSS